MFSSQISMSSAAQFCISWVAYKNCISKGFSRFQQNGDFVDMTLAAEGHLVKVHQNIVALASPYLKAMIQSTPCQHPVVFLNNITQEMLSFILEYIYTGEVKIPKESTPDFIEACKALHINGVENLYLPKVPETESQPARVDVAVERLAESLPPPDNNFAAHITINSDNFNVEVIPNENNTTLHQTQPIISLDKDLMNYQVLIDAKNANIFEQDCFPPPTDNEPPSSPLTDREENQSKTLLNSDDNTTKQDRQNITLNSKEILPSAHSTDKVIPPSIGDRDKAQHYSLSNRGSLQLLLNRYMYYCHHHSCEGRKRRWRCVDYRKLRCPALVDTDSDNIINRYADDGRTRRLARRGRRRGRSHRQNAAAFAQPVHSLLVNRSEVHSHSNHDTKILRKFKSKKVFTTLSQAQDKVAEKPPRVRGKKSVIQKTT